jgi:hypothetical protein
MNFRRLCIASLLLLGFCLCANPNPQQTRWLSYEPTVVELEGNLTVEIKYGPPNYGENPKTDEKVNVPILVLSQPINVRGDPKSELNKETVEGVTRIQLVFDKTSTTYKQFVGSRVLVKGTLFKAHSGHHYTDVLVSVQDIRKQLDKRN